MKANKTEGENMEIKRFVSKLLDSNTYVLKNGNEALIIDCGCQPSILEEALNGEKVVGILLTHGHYDHSKYCNEYAQKFDCKIYASAAAAETLRDSEANYSEDNFTIEDHSRFELIEKDGILNIGSFEVQCFSAAGHCKCCECFLIDGNLFAGDVLFERGIGRTDLKGSSKDEMLASLSKLGKLEFDRCFSGHGDESLREEQYKNINIFKRFLSR